jgi:hypothetical protein
MRAWGSIVSKVARYGLDRFQHSELYAGEPGVWLVGEPCRRPRSAAACHDIEELAAADIDDRLIRGLLLTPRSRSIL